MDSKEANVNVKTNVKEDFLANLDENLRGQIMDLVAKKVKNAIGVISCIEMPIYNFKRMTSATYFKKCRFYFTAYDYKPEQFHEILPLILRGEFKVWYDRFVGSIDSWRDVEELFVKEFDNELF